MTMLSFGKLGGHDRVFVYTVAAPLNIGDHDIALAGYQVPFYRHRHTMSYN